MDSNTENPTPSAEETPTQPPTEESGQMPTQQSRNLALLCHLLGFLTSFIGPLILWLMKKDEDSYLDHHGKEALNFQIMLLIAYFIGGLLSIICIGVFVLLAAWIVNIVFSIMACVAASQGKMYRYPVSLRLIK